MCVKFPEMAKARQVTPWWLEDGTELCSPCGQTYAYQTEYRCVFCDGPICPMCAEVTVTLDIFCPACRETAAAESEG